MKLGAGATTPQAALAHYARVYTDWSSRTVASVQRELAEISLGQARAQAQAAASYGKDTVLARSNVANSGEVVAITPSQRVPGEWVVVTSEQTTGQGDYAGLPAALHVTYARVSRTDAGYVVSQWAPQT